MPTGQKTVSPDDRLMKLGTIRRRRIEDLHHRISVREAVSSESALRQANRKVSNRVAKDDPSLHAQSCATLRPRSVVSNLRKSQHSGEPQTGEANRARADRGP